MKIIKRILLFVLIAILFSVCFTLFYMKGQYEVVSLKNKHLREASYRPPTTTENLDIPKFDVVDGITNILLLGADFRATDDVARTDAMMILTIDTIHDKVKLTSLLRDNLVEIPGYGKSKLNHAYAWGGEKLLQSTIKKNYNINIDKYVLIDFNGFKTVIDKLGGVEVEVKEQELNELNKYIFDIPDENAKEVTSAGIQTLNGAQALSYVRIRKGVGDEYGRTERQRALLNSLMKKAKDTSVFKYPTILKSVMENFETNLSITEMLNLANTILNINSEDIQSSYAPFTEISIGGEYQKYGWVFRTDLSVTAKLLNRYIYFDETPNFNDIDKSTLEYIK